MTDFWFVLSTPIASIDHLSISLLDPDASNVHWTLECYNGEFSYIISYIAHYLLKVSGMDMIHKNNIWDECLILHYN